MTVSQLGKTFYKIGKISSYRRCDCRKARQLQRAGFRFSFLAGSVYSTVWEISSDMLLSPLLLTAVTTR